MAAPNDVTNMALFCDFENIALGVRDANYEKFDIGKVLERLLLKGSIVVKKAYCDWERYKEFKAPMHEASFELIEIPHVRQSGKNSADIRMVVDALDLCYTKAHVDTFVIISGDSDFSPLVSQAAREQQDGDRRRRQELDVRPADRQLRRVHLLRRPGAREREAQARARARRRPRRPAARARAGPSRPPTPTTTLRPRADEAPARKGDEERRQEALDLIVETVEALIAERGDEEKIWGSMVKQALKRRKPGFNESYYGFRSFNGMLEEAAARRQRSTLERDEKSGGYIVRLVAAGGMTMRAARAGGSRAGGSRRACCVPRAAAAASRVLS